MKVRNLGLGLVLAGLTLAVPAFAQDPKGGGGAPGGGASERSGGGGAAASTGGGTASARGGGGGGSVATSSGGGSSVGSVGSISSPSGAGAFSSDLSSAGVRGRESAPSRRSAFSSSASPRMGDSDQKATPRSAGSNGSNGGGERAVPRGSSASGSNGSNGSNGSTGSANSSTGARTRATSDNNAAGAREVPNWSRPRGDRPATGAAVDRVGPPPDPDRDGRYHGRYYDPYYYGGGYYGSFYDPFGYYSYGCYACPYSWGLGYGLYSGFGWNPYFGAYDPYYSGSGSYSSGVYNTQDQGHLRLKVKPRNARVYVDGYFVGLIDEFDGSFQRLALNGGRHKVEVRAEGYETAEFDVLITPDKTVTFQGDLKRIQ